VPVREILTNHRYASMPCHFVLEREHLIIYVGISHVEKNRSNPKCHVIKAHKHISPNSGRSCTPTPPPPPEPPEEEEDSSHAQAGKTSHSQTGRTRCHPGSRSRARRRL